MAESYRGLTIRIGGDTTGLTNALKTADQAAAGTQQELRKLGQALKMDPSNVQAYSLQMGYMANQVAATSMKLYQLKDAQEQIGKSGIKLASGEMSEPVEKLAAATKDAHMQAAQAKAAYNKVTDSLSDMYTTLSKYNEEVAKTAGKEAKGLVGDLNIGSSLSELEEFKKSISALFTKYDGVVQKPKKSIDEIVESLKKFHEQYTQTDSAVKQSKLEQQFDDILEKVTQLKGVKVNFDADNTSGADLKDITNRLKELQELGFDKSQIDEYLKEVGRLKSEYKSAMDELQKANAVAQFADLQAEIIKTEASVKSVAKAMADMKAPSDVMRGMTELTEKVDVLKKSYSELKQQASSAESSYSINTSNEEAREAAMRSYAEAERVAIERAEELKKQIAGYDREKIDQYTDATKSATMQLANASIAATEASVKLGKYRGVIEATSKYYKALKLDASEVAKVLNEDWAKRIGGFTLGEADLADTKKMEESIEILEKMGEVFSEFKRAASESGDLGGSQEWEERVSVVNNTIAAVKGLIAAEEEERSASEKLEYSKQRKELEELLANLASAIGEIDATRVSMQKLAAGEVKPKVDTTDLDRLKDARKDIESYGSSVAKSMNDAANDVKILSAVMDNAASRATALFETFGKNPANFNALSLGFDAVDESMTGCIIKAEQLQKLIAGYTSDKIDEVAIATNTVGINAERAAHAVDEAFKKVDDAHKRADEAAKAYSDALKSAEGNTGGENNTIVENLKKESDAATAEFERLQKAADDALKALDIANATKQLVGYREELAQVSQDYAKFAELYTDALRTESVTSAFGDTSDIDELAENLKNAANTAKELEEAIKFDPTNTELLTAKTIALAEKQGIAKQATEAIANALKKIDPEEIKKLQERFGSVATAVKASATAVTVYKSQLEVARKEFDKLVKDEGLDGMQDDILALSSDVESKLTPSIIKTRDEVLALEDALEGASRAFDTASVASKATSLGSQFGSVTDDINKRGTKGVDEAAFQQALSRMSQYAEQAGRYIVESADTIDAAYRDMRKTVNGTEEEFAALKQAAIDFSQTNAVSADTILEMESLGGQLGIAVSRLQEFGEVASHLDIATDIGAEDIALQMGQLKNIMSDFDDSNFVNFADALVRLGNNTATTESAIMNVAQRMAAVANVTSMTTPELLAWSAAIASTGQRSESAATSITRTITGIGQAVSEGGASLQQFAKIAGMSAEEFEDKWRNSSSEALEAFVKGLGTLTDDSTEAIAALDAVGISSVRQETALLALSQTIGNLDASLEHATVGWNNSGDAAREAGEKSKGFSGALQILKNNAADFAESFGDGMVAPMQAASSALGVLTDLLNVIPGPIKTVMVSIAGLGTAVGTTYPMFSTLTEKMSDSGLTLKYLPTLMSATAQGAEGMSAALIAAGVSAEEAGKMVTAFGTALKATGIGLAITAGLALVGEIVKAYQDWAEHEDLVKNATTGLTESLGAAASAYDEYAESLKKTSMTYQEVHDATESTLKSVAAFSETIGETLATVGENFAAAEHYGEIIKELGNKGRISSDDLSTLNNAIDQYNSITGSSIEVTDAVTGALNILSPAIDAVTEAYERQAEQQAYYELYNEAIKEQAKVKVELQQIDEELSDAEKDLGDSFWSAFDYEGLTRVNQLKESQEELQASMESLTDTSDSLKDMIGDTAYEFPDLETALVAAGGSLDDFGSLTDEEKDKLREIEAALNQAGSSLYNYGALNSSQLSAIAAAWNGSAGDIVASINKIKKETESVSSSVQKASDAAVTALKRAQEDAYTAMKRQLDDEYDSLKKSLDSQYNARKKELDNEYKAAKSASDKWLKEFKKAQEAEVDAFKEATDAKLAEMEKEYEYKKKLLDDEYSGYDSEIQSKIDAIKAEQTAEDDAKKQQERQEKLSELQLEVQRAKTRKKRQEAEKKLNEYLEEIRAEDTKAAREAEIDKLEDQRDALKDQLSERQDTLKESYDLAVNEYKSEREAILKLMKEAQESEYDAQKEAQEAQLQSMKDSHDAELEALKAHNEEILKEKKRANEDALTALKREQEDALNALKKGYEEIEKETEEAAEKVAESTHKIAEESKLSLNDILKSLAENGRIHLDTYLGYMNQMPGSVREIFDQLGLTVDNGLGEVARIMLENGDITLQQYLAIMSQMPGSTTAICNETGLQIAEQLGLLGNDVTNAATGIVTTVEENTRDVANITTQRGVEAGMGLASLGGQETVDTAARNSQTLRDALETPFSNIGEAGEAAGSSWNVGLTNGFNKDADKPIQSAHDVAEATVKQMDISDSTKTLGSNAAIGWNNGWVPGANKALDNVTAWASSVISAITKTHLIHSPSRKFKWLAEMDMKGFEEGWNLGARSVEKSVQKTSNSLLDAMSEGDYDITQSIIDSMKAREDDLRNQAERMARIIEDGFDPTLTVDAAYEAIDRIDEGKYRRQRLMADKYPQQQPANTGVTINVNIPELVVREEADVERISSLIALKVQRQLNSRIG